MKLIAETVNLYNDVGDESVFDVDQSRLSPST